MRRQSSKVGQPIHSVSVTATPSASPYVQQATATLHLAKRLRNGRYVLTVNPPGVIDLAGNPLAGAFQALLTIDGRRTTIHPLKKPRP